MANNPIMDLKLTRKRKIVIAVAAPVLVLALVFVVFLRTPAMRTAVFGKPILRIGYYKWGTADGGDFKYLCANGTMFEEILPQPGSPMASKVIYDGRLGKSDLEGLKSKLGQSFTYAPDPGTPPVKVGSIGNSGIDEVASEGTATYTGGGTATRTIGDAELSRYDTVVVDYSQKAKPPAIFWKPNYGPMPQSEVRVDAVDCMPRL